MAERRAPREGRDYYVRFSPYHRLSHFIMMTTFIGCALTGPPLKYSYDFWAQAMMSFWGGVENAGLIHRIMAGFMMGVFAAHVFYLAYHVLVKKAKIFGPDSIMFRKKDLADMVGMIKWFFDRGERPKFERFTFWEKFDWFAVFWGIAMIGTSGFALWFPTYTSQIVSGIFLNVARLIHGDEAILAIGWILFVHLYNSHLRMNVFPMDPVIFTGRMPVEHLKHDKAAWYERLVAEGKIEPESE
jgi:cytochrome b subunit of formate dehydrogenase